MSSISSAVLNGFLEGMVVTLSEGNLDDLNSLGRAYQRLKSVDADGEDANLVSEILNNLLIAMQKPHPEDLEILSSTYQRVASIELNKTINNLQEKSV